MMLRFLFCVGLAWALAAGAEESLFDDVRFERGFTLSGANHEQIRLDGALRFPDGEEAAAPAWNMPQWGTTELLTPGEFEARGGGVYVAENPVKRVRIERPESGPVAFLLESRAIEEFDGHMREKGEPWPHLLIEQSFSPTLRLADFEAMPFALEFRVPHCDAADWAEGKLDPSRHTAQVSAYWTVHNVTEGHPEKGDMIWFGIPLFDVRQPIPEGHFAIDAGQPDASGKFICSMQGERFFETPTGDGEWHAVDEDLRALIEEGLAIAQEHGHLTESAVEDLGITSFNLGWEIPGPYNAAIEFRGLAFTGR